MIDGITIKKVAEDLRKLIDRVPDNAKPSDVRMLKAGYKNMIDIIEKIFSYEIHDKETGLSQDMCCIAALTRRSSKNGKA